jgi:hypothetical protein
MANRLYKLLYDKPDFYNEKYSLLLRGAGKDPALLNEPGMREHLMDFTNHPDMDRFSSMAENALVMRMPIPGEWFDALSSFDSPNKPAVFGGSGKQLIVDVNPKPTAAPVLLGASGRPLDPWADSNSNTTQKHKAADVAVPDMTQPIADLISNSLENHSAGGPGTSTAKGADVIDKQLALRMAGEAGDYDIGTGAGATPLRSSTAAASTAKGAANIAEKAAERGVLQHVDDFLSAPGHSIGVAGEAGLNKAAGYLESKGMTNLAGMAGRLAPVARWGAPLAAGAAAIGLPTVMGAMSGNDKAGAGGAVLEGGGALAGGLIGQALIPIPFVGAGIGSMVGQAVGGGLASGAAAAVEKAQQGDTGLMGMVGRAIDPFVDTAFEKEQAATLQQMNSPAMQQIRAQEQARISRARADQTQAALNQLYAQGLY